MLSGRLPSFRGCILYRNRILIIIFLHIGSIWIQGEITLIQFPDYGVLAIICTLWCLVEEIGVGLVEEVREVSRAMGWTSNFLQK